MANPVFEQLCHEVKALSHEELQRLQMFLEVLLASAGQQLDEDDQAELKMLVDGVVDHVPWPRLDRKSIESWKPVEIEGKPLSETILEERR